MPTKSPRPRSLPNKLAAPVNILLVVAAATKPGTKALNLELYWQEV